MIQSQRASHFHERSGCLSAESKFSSSIKEESKEWTFQAIPWVYHALVVGPYRRERGMRGSIPNHVNKQELAALETCFRKLPHFANSHSPLAITVQGEAYVYLQEVRLSRHQRNSVPSSDTNSNMPSWNDKSQHQMAFLLPSRDRLAQAAKDATRRQETDSLAT